MNRLWRVLIAAVLACGWLVVLAPDANAEDGKSWRIDRFHMDVELDQRGTATVRLSLDFNFGREAGHGPFISLPTRQETSDPRKWLDLGVKFVEASSPSGANSNTQVIRDSDGILLKIGRKGETFTGVHTYEITYQLTGLVAANHKDSGLDEFNWNAVGPLWQVPISDVSVRLTGPAQISKATCFYGSGYDTSCSAEHDGATASYAVGYLSAETPMQVVAGFPAGTFPGVTQTFSPRHSLETMFPLTPATGATTLGLSVLGGWLVRARVKRRLRDEAYLGLPPGIVPAQGQQTQVGEVTKLPVAVQFQPPRGARPGEVGTLLDASADNEDVTATIIDLAVRGYLVITPLGDGDYAFERTQRSSSDLVDYERNVLKVLFQNGPRVTTEEMADEDYAPLLSETRSKLYQRVVELKWFRKNPSHTRLLVVLLAILISLGGIGLGFLLGFVGWGLIGLAGPVIGITLGLSLKSFTARTPEGSAVLAQTKGFELYLATAEADQIRFEEGIDVFSRYLPYAIIFGVTDRWVKIFKELEQRGIYVADTGWYGGSNIAMFHAASFGHAMSSMTEAMSSAMSSSLSAATTGSSGGSGFSGGGGFGGGGGGGW